MLVVEIIRLLSRHANEERHGMVLRAWLSMRSYPAVLLFTAYGIGLVRGKRWRALHRFLTSEIESGPNEDPHRIVETLFLASWEGGDNDYWKILEGIGYTYTALSDHLCRDIQKLGR